MQELHDTDQIAARLTQLESSLPLQGAAVVVDFDHEETIVTANRAGFLRLGLEIMKAAIATPSPMYGGSQESVPVALDDFVKGAECVLFRRAHVLPEPTPAVSKTKQVIGAALAGGVLLLLVVFTILGCRVAMEWIFS